MVVSAGPAHATGAAAGVVSGQGVTAWTPSAGEAVVVFDCNGAAAGGVINGSPAQVGTVVGVSIVCQLFDGAYGLLKTVSGGLPGPDAGVAGELSYRSNGPYVCWTVTATVEVVSGPTVYPTSSGCSTPGNFESFGVSETVF
jgi:hypothetical protein